MNARLLASATQRSAVMERMQNVAKHERGRATKPIPVDDRQVPSSGFPFGCAGLCKMHAGGLTLFAASLRVLAGNCLVLTMLDL